VNYLKSTNAGILALLLVAAAIATIVVITRPTPSGTSFVVIHWRFASPLLWLVAAVVFGAGFFWELRRLSK
jgi:hypothetical protein